MVQPDLLSKAGHLQHTPGPPVTAGLLIHGRVGCPAAVRAAAGPAPAGVPGGRQRGPHLPAAGLDPAGQQRRGGGAGGLRPGAGRPGVPEHATGSFSSNPGVGSHLIVSDFLHFFVSSTRLLRFFSSSFILC